VKTITMEVKKEILFVTSYPSRECGIATYSQDLVNAISEKYGNSFSISICALNNGNEKRNYPEEVKFILNSSDVDSYIEIADKIGSDGNIVCVCVQHEFGLFTGVFGENLIYFLCSLNKPIVTTFHTIMPQPGLQQLSVVQTIIKLSDGIIVSTQNSARLLKEIYNTPSEKISVIPHGTHQRVLKDKNVLKLKYNLSDRLVLSTFGLISSNKSIETVLESLTTIKRIFPNVIYLVLGKTHPTVLEEEGEKYRDYLWKKVKDLKLMDNVLFVNRYLPLDELLNYLSLTDVYLFTSKDPNQAVSGTFAYAMSAACPIISTPIPHAKEVIDKGTGLFFDFGNAKQLAEAAISLLGDDVLRKEMGINALHKIRSSSWENVAISHLVCFNQYVKPNINLTYEIPAVSLNHMDSLTTRSGILQFSNLSTPDLSSGYTLDDNARALIALISYYEIKTDSTHIDKIDIYLNFIKYCQQEDGTFLNYVTDQGKFDSKNSNENLEDANGRAIWALGVFISKCSHLHPYFQQRAENIFEKSLDPIVKLTSPRAMSFAIKGLFYYNKIRESLKVKFIIHVLSKKLIDNYYDNFDHGWEWFEQYLTYANSVLPEAMLYSYLSSGDEMYKIVANDSFDFLLSKIFSDTSIQVISNAGWHQRGTELIKYGEQPIDVAYTILALQTFYSVFKEDRYLGLMDKAFDWFLGNNHFKQTIYTAASGGCCDGLEEKSVNLNQGAESTVCYLLARLAMEEKMITQTGVGKSELMHDLLVLNSL